MQLDFTKDELKGIYSISKGWKRASSAPLLRNRELDHFDERLIDRRVIGRILEKLRRSLTKGDREMLLRKYSVYGSEVDEDVYSKLEKAFSNRNTVEIEYFSMEKAEGVRRKIDIHYKSRKYIIAFCHLKKAIRRFRPSRIMSARLSGEKYWIPEDFDKRKFL